MIRRLINRVAKWVQARYEAAFTRFGDRSWVLNTVQDARFDADGSTRFELMRRSRYWEKNNGLIQKVYAIWEQFTIGPKGLMVVPDSDADEWNPIAGKYFRDWCMEAGIDGLSMCQIEKLSARREFYDGEVFWKKALATVKIPVTNERGVKVLREVVRPRLQVIEAHRIFTPLDQKHREGYSVIDGVEVDPDTLSVKGYWYNETPIVNKFMVFFERVVDTRTTFIPAEEIIHIFEPTRPGMLRGLPRLTPVMNDLHDLDDLQQYEMTAAKDASIITNVVTNAVGELNPAAMRKQMLNIQSTDQQGNPIVKQVAQYSETVLGAKTIALRKGEDIKQFASDRPSVTTREYWDYLLAKICCGIGVSRLLVLPFSMQGTVTRSDLDVQAGFFKGKSEIISGAKREAYEWVMGWAVAFDKTLDGAPKDWTEVVIRPPRGVNVDVGRNSQAILAELQAGTRTFQDVYAELGEDWREQLTQKATERAFLHKLAEEISVKQGLTKPLTIDEIAATTTPVEPNTPAPQEKGAATSPATTATP